MVAVTAAAVAGGIKTAGEIAESIKKMTDLIPKAADELKEKFRWMTVVVRNETQFELTHTASHFEHGRFWQAPPGVIGPFESGEFSVCSKDGSIGTGVTGGIRLEVELEGMRETLYIGVGFAKPAVGNRKASVVFRKNRGGVARDATDELSKNTMRDDSRNLTGKNSDGRPVVFELQGVSSPGQGTVVTITQKILKG